MTLWGASNFTQYIDRLTTSLLNEYRMTMTSLSLEERIAALENGATFDATQSAIREREAEMLNTLRGIQAAMQSETSGVGSAEVAALKEENAQLKALTQKQAYRIQHLIQGLEAARSKTK